MKTKPIIRGLVFLTFSFLIFLSILPCLAVQESSQPEKKIEPLSIWTKQWLEVVVPYIITSKEKKYFKNLPTEEERGEFIIRFWKVRDPDPSTPENEFKLEHYRRIAIANKFFGASGIAGWRTIRGKIFILLGPPNYIKIDTKPNPAVDDKKAKTITFPFRYQADQSLLWGHHGGKEVWTYYGIPNSRVPYSMEFVFMDKHGTGNYQLEQTVKLGDRVNMDLERGGMKAMTKTFDQLENMADAMRNPFEKGDKLKGIVTTQVAYEYIPIEFDVFNLKGSEEKTYSTLSVEIPYSALSSKLTDGKYYFSLNVTVIIRNKENKFVFEGSKETNFYRTDTEFKVLKNKVYNLQIPMTLDLDSYKIELLVLDNYSGKVGTLEKEILLSSLIGEELMLSNIFLSSAKEEVSAVDDATSDLNVFAMKNVFCPGEEMKVSLEVYNLTLNPETGLCDFKAEYLFFHKGKLLAKVPTPVERLKDQRDYKLSTSFKLKNFNPGEYILRVKVIDSNSGDGVSEEIQFFITE